MEKFYIPTRYPDAFPEGNLYEFYDTEEADEALKYSSKIIEFVRKIYDEQGGKVEKEREGRSSGKS